MFLGALLYRAKVERRSVCIVLLDTVSSEKLRLNRVVGNNLKVRLGDVIALQSGPMGRGVSHVFRIGDGVEGLDGPFTRMFLPC